MNGLLKKKIFMPLIQVYLFQISEDLQQRMQLHFVLAFIVVVFAKKQLAYTIRYSKSYNPAKIPQNIGCSEKNVVYGNFIYPQGPVDVLYLITNPHTYHVYLQCKNDRIFSKIFGTGQDYQSLFKVDPNTVANSLRGSVGHQNYIIDWKYSPQKNFITSKRWLVTFVQALNKFNKNVYIKAPASYFCYNSEGKSYLLDQQIKAKFIIEMYGEQPGKYVTYDQIFGQLEKITDQTECSYPNYAYFFKKYPKKDFYIEKTLQIEEAGYIGKKLDVFISKSQKIYDKLLFYDSFEKQIIEI